MADAPDEEKQALLHFLEYQRASVLSIVEGLNEEAWHKFTSTGVVYGVDDPAVTDPPWLGVSA
jgi:hypothetical protein